MMNQISKIKYYAMCLLVAFGYYGWASFSGSRIFGDDNENKDGHTITSYGNGHGGGHGFFLHK